MLPAPGQGALAVECRDADTALVSELAGLQDQHARAAVDAERAVLATLEGGCSAPIGALAEVAEGDEGEELWIRAVALSHDGALTHAARAKVVVRQGKKARVVRLLAGDPFLYASGPEEAQACVKAGIGFEIVPGVSSVAAVPAYAGIPLTTKDKREVAVVACGG